MKTIYILRHGETDYNNLGIIQGSSINSSINENGRKQAQDFYEKYKNFPFDIIYITGKIRTYQSVENFINKGLKYQQLDEFNEMNWGDFEGRKKSEEMLRDLHYVLNQWKMGNTTYAPNNAENPEDVQKRLIEGMKLVVAQKDHKNILICMHGRAMRFLLPYLDSKPLSAMEEYPIPNLGLYVVEYNENTNSYQIIQRADISHLNPNSVKEVLVG